MTRLGTVLSVASAPLAESAATAFDLLWLDLEHGSLTVGDAQALAIAVQSAGCEAHVRLPRWDSELLPAVLDAGVDGVVAPRVESAEEAAAFARRLRYPPAGTRGYGLRRAGGYGRAGTAPVPAGAVQIESPAAVAAAGAIAAVDGVDALVVGCADLAFELGVPGTLRSPRLREAVARVAAAAAEAGRDFGIAGGGAPGDLAAVLSRRPALVVYSVDVRLYAHAVDAAARELGAALEDVHAAA